jgi:hypothetical protein
MSTVRGPLRMDRRRPETAIMGWEGLAAGAGGFSGKGGLLLLWLRAPGAQPLLADTLERCG